MALYAFEFADGDWIKVGHCAYNPWIRAMRGFAAQVHPPQLCGKLLNLEGITLLGLWRADLAVEKAIHRDLEGVRTGEFYAKATFAAMVLPRLEGMAPLEPPARPDPAAVRSFRDSLNRPLIDRPCCSGAPVQCFDCHRSLSSYKQLRRHRLRCPALQPRS